MRIGFVTDVYKPYVSGVTHSVSLNRWYLEEHGHETYVFAFADPRVEPVEPKVIQSPGIKVRGTAEYRVGPRLTREARRVLATMDVVNVDDPFVSGRMALPTCKRNSIPVVFTNHTRVDLYAEYYAKIMPSILRNHPLRWYMRKYCRDVDLVLAPAESMVDVLVEMGIDVPVEVVPNGVEIDRFLSVPRGFDAAARASAAARAELGLHEDDIVYAYSGRLGPEKNLDLLIDAFSRVARVVPNARLLMVGGGPYRKKVEAAVSRARVGERVIFTGMVPYEEIPRHLVPVDVWVTASVSEVHPLTVIEAMAAGLPIVGIESTGISDTVEHGVTGLLAAREDAGAVAECMLALATDTGRRQMIGMAAREAAKRYSISSTGAQMAGIYESLAAEAARKRADATIALAARPNGAVGATAQKMRQTASKVKEGAAKARQVASKTAASAASVARPRRRAGTRKDAS